ncbi:unnamed protein product [Trichogramma brassicae]|uniref:Uncharacterized protein n=1 Tax=Trichogramma brassicae TaxID=86971 RepID=A0A6H5I0A0_9HYME|nr:unnamed protein product [Trichogramma brassicae]
MSKRMPKAKGFPLSDTMDLASPIASAVERPALKPNCLEEALSSLEITGRRRHRTTLFNTLLSTGNKHTGLYDFRAERSLSGDFSRTQIAPEFQPDGNLPNLKQAFIKQVKGPAKEKIQVVDVHLGFVTELVILTYHHHGPEGTRQLHADTVCRRVLPQMRSRDVRAQYDHRCPRSFISLLTCDDNVGGAAERTRPALVCVWLRY